MPAGGMVGIGVWLSGISGWRGLMTDWLAGLDGWQAGRVCLWLVCWFDGCLACWMGLLPVWACRLAGCA
jgi:hypothetical protein